MKKHIVFFSVAIVLGGMATVTIIDDHSPTITADLKKDALKQFDVASLMPLTVVAKMDYTPVSVIRPATEMLVINYGNVALPNIVTPVIPVAHGPPKCSLL